MAVAASVALVAWGALAFGAVYPWAYAPLLAGCGLTGTWLLLERGRRMPPSARRFVIALLALLGAASLQLVPLSPSLLARISPSATEFLQNYDLRYAVEPFAHPVSIAPALTRRGVLFFGAFLLLLAGLARGLSGSRVQRLTSALVAFGAILAVIAIVQKATLGDHTYMGMKIYGFWTPESKLVVPFGPYVNRNHFAGWMIMALPLAIGILCARIEAGARHVSGWRNRLLWLSTPEGGSTLLVLLAVLLMAASLVMSMSRSGMAAFALTAAIAALRLLRSLQSAGARAAAIATFLVVLFVPVMWLGVDPTVERFSSDSRNSIETRLRVWRDTREIIRDFPLTGTGLNTFGTATVVYQTGSRDVHFQEAHSDYLQLLAEGGVLLAVPGAAALVFFILAARRRLVVEPDRTVYWIRFGAAMGILAIALQSTVEFSLQMPGNATLLVVLMGIVLQHGVRTPVHGASASVAAPSGGGGYNAGKTARSTSVESIR